MNAAYDHGVRYGKSALLGREYGSQMASESIGQSHDINQHLCKPRSYADANPRARFRNSICPKTPNLSDVLCNSANPPGLRRHRLDQLLNGRSRLGVAGRRPSRTSAWRELRCS